MAIFGWLYCWYSFWLYLILHFLSNHIRLQRCPIISICTKYFFYVWKSTTRLYVGICFSRVFPRICLSVNSWSLVDFPGMKQHWCGPTQCWSRMVSTSQLWWMLEFCMLCLVPWLEGNCWCVLCSLYG